MTGHIHSLVKPGGGEEERSGHRIYGGRQARRGGGEWGRGKIEIEGRRKGREEREGRRGRKEVETYCIEVGQARKGKPPKMAIWVKVPWRNIMHKFVFFFSKLGQSLLKNGKL